MFTNCSLKCKTLEAKYSYTFIDNYSVNGDKKFRSSPSYILEKIAKNCSLNATIDRSDYFMTSSLRKYNIFQKQ